MNDTEVGLDHDVFRFVALIPTEAFREPSVDLQIEDGNDRDDLLTFDHTRFTVFKKKALPAPSTPLSSVRKIGSGDDLTLARRVVAKRALGGDVDRERHVSASAVVLSHWLETEAGKDLLFEKPKMTWAALVVGMRYLLPNRLRTAPAVTAAPAPTAELTKLAAGLQPLLARLPANERLLGPLWDALSDTTRRDLVATGFDPERHDVAKLRELLPDGFTPHPDATLPPVPRGGIRIQIPGHHGFPIPKIPVFPIIPGGASVPVVGTLCGVHVGDLLTVKETLIGYGLTEISDIENIMARMLRERTHRRLQRMETTIESETETTLESEKTHQTTERSELQFESSQSLKTNEKVDVGANVTVRGGFVDASAHAGYQLDIAKDEAKKQAATFAKEVVDKAVEKSRLRKRELKIVRMLDETEDAARLTTDNRNDASHIRGIYRWVEKRLSVTLHNYGRRTIYTFLLPEPSQGFIAKRAELVGTGGPPMRPHVIEGKPARPYDPAQSQSGSAEKKIVPLKPEHIENSNYFDFAAFWRVDGSLEAPKDWEATWTMSRSTTNQFSADGQVAHGSVSVAFDQLDESTQCTMAGASAVLTMSPNTQTWKISGDSTEIKGVDLDSSSLALTAHGRDGGTSIKEGIGNPLKAEYEWEDSTEEAPCVAARQLAFSAVGTAPWGFALGLEVVLSCGYRYEAKLQWQHKICAKILSEYVRQVDAYEEQLASVKPPPYPAPGTLDTLIKGEIRSRILSIVTNGQVVPIDVVAFLDRAFEWEELAWTFVAPWDGSSAMTGETTGEPTLDAFLQAAAARSRLSVKPGYEAAVALYLGSNRLSVPKDVSAKFDDELGVVPPAELEDPQDLGEITVPTNLVLLMNPSEVKDIATRIKDETGKIEWKPVVFAEIKPPSVAPS